MVSSAVPPPWPAKKGTSQTCILLVIIETPPVLRMVERTSWVPQGLNCLASGLREGMLREQRPTSSPYGNGLSF